MSRPHFNAQFTINSVTELPAEDEGTIWQVDGSVTDMSTAAFEGTEVQVGFLIFTETEYGDLEVFKIKRIISATYNSVVADVFFIGAGVPFYGQPNPTFASAICANLGADRGATPSPAIVGISDYLFNAVRNWNDGIDEIGEGTSISRILVASEGLLAGDFVNIHDDAGVAKVRKAIASPDYYVDGYVLVTKNAGEEIEVFLAGENTQLTVLEAGKTYYLSTVPGKVTLVPPSGTGNVVQVVGKAVSETSLSLDAGDPIILA